VKVALMTGDYPGIISGISDYSSRLKEHLEALGDMVYVITSLTDRVADESVALKIAWGMAGFRELRRFLKANGIKALNIQYPCSLYGKYNLFPHLYAVLLRLCGVKIITTLHEFSNINLLRRLSEYIFIIFSHRIIMTNSRDHDAMKRQIPFIGEKVSVVPIGSNIGGVNESPRFGSRYITYFGIFYPRKGAERVIDIMETLDRSFENKYIFKFIGGAHPYYPDYLGRFREIAESRLSRTEWHLDLPLDDIGPLLADSFLSVMYFRDGASLRRGSILAAIANGVPVISNRGAGTDLREIEEKGLFYVDEDLSNCVEIVQKLQREEFYRSVFSSLIRFAKRFDFRAIAREYQKNFRLFEE
jgi:glycosyltransferase involved in cell wall biosynthesis